jgi:hypothetical protein
MEMAMLEDRKREYLSGDFGWEKTVATIWLVLIVILLIGLADRVGRPAFDASPSAEAADTQTTGRATVHTDY